MITKLDIGMVLMKSIYDVYYTENHIDIYTDNFQNSACTKVNIRQNY